MKHVLDEDLIYEILSVVEEIPEGCVATYGQIARLIGREKNSRLVGKVLSMAEYYGQVTRLSKQTVYYSFLSDISFFHHRSHPSQYN